MNDNIFAIGVRAFWVVLALLLPVSANSQPAMGQFSSTPLCDAIASRDESRAKQLVEQGADINASYGCALAAAAERGMLAMVELLLDRGANPNMHVSGDPSVYLGGSSPLVAAVQSRDARMLRLLLQRGADPREDFDAFSIVLNFGDVEMAELLLSHGANPNMTSPAEGDVYAYPGDEMVKVSPRDLEPDRIDSTVKRFKCSISDLSQGTSLLYLTIAPGSPGTQEGKDRIAKLLIDRGAGPNARTLNGTTPLMFAASQHNHAIMKMLMEAGADVKATDRCGRTAEDHADLHSQHLFAPLAPQTKALLKSRPSGQATQQPAQSAPASPTPAAQR